MTHHASDIPDSFLAKWQTTTNVLAGIFDVPAGLIMRVLPGQIEVLVSSHSEGNPYEADEKAQLNTGLYCETVMATRALLHVPHALEDTHWEHNPDVALNMVSYLGVPLLWPDKEVFGTICVLDSKKRNYQDKYVELLWEIKKSIERDFVVIEQQRQLLENNAELQAALQRLTALQDELLRSEKLAALGAVVAGISHELNTPIGNSLLAASTLQCHAADFAVDMKQGLTRSRMLDFVSTVEQGAGILMRSLDQAAKLVGSFKQVVDDQSAADRRRFDLGEMVRSVLSELNHTIQGSGHRVHCAIAPGILLDSYPQQLAQVMTHLVSNAVQHAFLPGVAGTVRIAAQPDSEGQVVLTVRDDGLGIPQANLGRVFDPFFTTRLGRGGSGLGLHIVYKLVTAALHGSVEASSEPGQGACFTVVLPLSAPAPLQKPEVRAVRNGNFV
ncbi:ATP-binding protein [Pseudoduganella sp. LjRoot289]|uniref:ATP-binding protein n=1 Tax=Pseudoduganella sp. LjRoot289 TaxID=3342314 RepID=UPI003ECEFB41